MKAMRGDRHLTLSRTEVVPPFGDDIIQSACEGKMTENSVVVGCRVCEKCFN